jgi:hypothetical protein
MPKSDSQNLLQGLFSGRMSTLAEKPSYFVSHTNPKFSSQLVQASLYPSFGQEDFNWSANTSSQRKGRTLFGRDLMFVGPPKAFTMHLGHPLALTPQELAFKYRFAPSTARQSNFHSAVSRKTSQLFTQHICTTDQLSVFGEVNRTLPQIRPPSTFPLFWCWRWTHEHAPLTGGSLQPDDWCICILVRLVTQELP